MENLKVPYGLSDSGDLVSADNAVKNASYACPCCNETLIFRAGDFRTQHFAHPPAANCSLESILHITAKRLIKDAMSNNAKGGKSINLKNACQNCGVEFYTELPPNTFSGAAEEIRVSEFICDVVGYRGHDIALAVEVFNTHRVEAKKAINLPVHWVELKAEDVIVNPYQWNPIQSQLKPGYCSDCKNHLQHVQNIADKWGVDRNLYSPIKNPNLSTYIADIEKCFKCKEEIPVFWWLGVPFCEFEPPSPHPKTIKYRNSKQYGGAYWANTCANCNMIQGDNYLFIFENAPFKDLPLSEKAAPSQSPFVKKIAISPL